MTTGPLAGCWEVSPVRNRLGLKRGLEVNPVEVDPACSAVEAHDRVFKRKSDEEKPGIE